MILAPLVRPHAPGELNPGPGPARAKADSVTGLSVNEIAAFAGAEVVQSVGDRVRLRREALGRARAKRFTQQELADMLGVSKPTISAWETGITTVSPENIRLLARALECTFEWLETGSGAEPAGMGFVPRADARPGAVKTTSLILRGTIPSDKGDFAFTGQVVGYTKRPPGLIDARTAYTFQAVSNTMSPLWEVGATIYVDPGKPYSLGDFVVIEMKPDAGQERGPAIVRRVIFLTDDSLEVWQSRPDKRTTLKLSDVAFVHRISRMSELFSL